MKRTATSIILCLCIATSAWAQSNSFLTFRNKFAGKEDAFSFSTNAFFVRTILWMAGEHEFNQAVRDIKNISLATVPKSAFAEERVTVEGFRKVIKEDAFEEMIRAKDHGDDVTIFARTTQNRHNRYIILVEEANEVVVIEIKGYVDPEILLNNGYCLFSNCKEKS